MSSYSESNFTELICSFALAIYQKTHQIVNVKNLLAARSGLIAESTEK
jgi:hypothetical protein